MSIFAAVEEDLVPDKGQTLSCYWASTFRTQMREGKIWARNKYWIFFNQQDTIKIKISIVKCSQITNKQKTRSRKV